MTTPVLVNEHAARGSGRDLLTRAIDRLRALGAGPEIVTAPTPDGLVARCRELVAGAPDRVIVAGGDGTVHTLLPALAGSGVVVGVVPFGTGNDFARGLGLATGNIDDAVDAALGEPVTIDLGRAGDRWFASVATLGFPTRVNARANGLRWPKGARRYTVATILEIPRLAPTPLTITIDGKSHRFDATLVAVGNTALFGGGMRVCPAADPTDGLLDVVVVGPTGRIELLRFFPKVFGGDHMSHRAVDTFRGHEIVVAPTEPTTATWADGEPFATGTITLTAAPAALKIAGARPRVADQDV